MKKRTKQPQRPQKVHVRAMSQEEASQTRDVLRSLLTELVRQERARGRDSDGNVSKQ